MVHRSGLGGGGFPCQPHFHSPGHFRSLNRNLPGAVAGNFGAYFSSAIFQSNSWINFLAGFGSIILTFLAGAEIEPETFRKQLIPSLTIGTVAFLSPFLGCMAYARYVSGWSVQAAQIAGIALSTTSMAVVYAVMGLKPV